MNYLIDNYKTSGINALSKFDYNVFKAPEHILGPAYFWVWNGELDKKTIKAQLEEMAEGGVKIVCIVPEPEQFRPLTMKTLLKDYLTPEYWDFFYFAVEEAKKLNMLFWFYDEGGWPSGGACGKVVEKHPHLIETVVAREEITIDESHFNEDTVAFFDGKTEIKNPQIGQKATRFFKKKIYCTEQYPLYPSLLEKEAVDTFINLTHEGLYKACDKMLGKNIIATFTDEPDVKHWPWPLNIREDFKKVKGYDLYDYLPAICTVYGNSDLSEDSVRAVIDYCDYCSERFVENYFDRIRKWCEKHRILSVGHVSGDDITNGSAIYGYWHILRVLRAFDIPGIDVIWRQIFPHERMKSSEKGSPYKSVNGSYANHYFPRYASSAAHQKGLRFALTETAGVYGSGFTFTQNHWVLGYQFVRGINIISEFGFSYARNGFLMASERPTWTDKMPGYILLKAFNDIIARESYLCSIGTPCVKNALYLPIKDIWASVQTREKAVAIHDRTAYILERKQVCFDVFDDDVLMQGEIRQGYLHFGGADYKCLIIPENIFIDKARVAECIKAGIKIVWVSDEVNSAPEGCKYITPSKLSDVVERTIFSDCEDLRVCKRETENGALYMLFNEGLSEICPVIKFNERTIPVEIDAINGVIRSVEGKIEKDGGFVFNPHMATGESLYLLFSNITATCSPRFKNAGKRLAISDFTFRPLRKFVIGDKEFEEQKFDCAERAVELGKWKNILGEVFSGECMYSCKFMLTKEQADKFRFLSLGKIEYSGKVNINGQIISVLTEPYVADVFGKLKEGENSLDIIVANTAANEFVFTKNFDKYSKAEMGSYHETAKQFEKESLGGGLLGPVELVEK